VKHGVDSQAEYAKGHYRRYPSEDTVEPLVRISPHHGMSVTLSGLADHCRVIMHVIHVGEILA
jgi:hypothetical protein